ncbi:MAG: hypothetical protein WCD08_15400 [Steroidobacteraceae bacterium]
MTFDPHPPLLLGEMLSAPIPANTKGLPPGAAGISVSAIAERGWNVLRGDVPLPAAVLIESALAHNGSVMREFTQRTGARLAPHGKTTMSPQLFERQLRDGAWAMTAATIGHVVTYRRFGVQRILFANQLVDRVGIRYILDELARDPAFEFYCLVDSDAGAATLAEALKNHSAGRFMNVLLEIGAPGGRTGTRTLQQTLALAASLNAHWPALKIRGLEAFEGIFSLPADPFAPQKVSAMLDHLRAAYRQIADRGWFAPGPVMLSAGGSAFFERTASELGELANDQVFCVLRSGCYVAHDHGLYDQTLTNPARLNSTTSAIARPLRPALEVWSHIQSRPEAGLGIAAFGKRDVSYDISLPKPIRWSSPANPGAQPLPSGVSVRALNDQHAYLDLAAAEVLSVGDLIGVGISHPCTTFDKWSLLYLVDDDYNVVGAVRTFF